MKRFPTEGINFIVNNMEGHKIKTIKIENLSKRTMKKTVFLLSLFITTINPVFSLYTLKMMFLP